MQGKKFLAQLHAKEAAVAGRKGVRPGLLKEEKKVLKKEMEKQRSKNGWEGGNGV